MRKLLFVSNNYFPTVIGGAEICVQTLAETLTARGHRVEVACIAADGRDSEDTVNGVRVHRMAIANVYTPFTGVQHPLLRSAWHAIDIYNPIMGRKFGKLLDRVKPDWVSANNIAGFSTAVWHATKQRDIPLAQVLHDYWAICPQTRMNKNGENCQTQCTVCKIYGAPKRPASRWPDLAIGVSRFALERHLEYGYFPNARTGVVYNGAAIDDPGPARVRKAGEPLTLGFIGRIEEAKGIELLLKAASRLPADRFRLRVAGRAPDPAYFEQLKQRYPLPQVEYLGFVSAAELYRSVDMLVVPSTWHETLCIVVYEALGYGIPVLASRVGGIPEILEGHDCGWLFRPNDADDLTVQLTRLLDGWPDAQGMRERALARRAYFTPERQADDFLALLA